MQSFVGRASLCPLLGLPDNRDPSATALSSGGRYGTDVGCWPGCVASLTTNDLSSKKRRECEPNCGLLRAPSQPRHLSPQCGGVGSLSVGSTYNRLLYLLPPNEYQSLLAIIPEIDEFHEVRAVTAALASGDVTGILPFPGKIVTTFCQIWSEQHPGRQPRIRWPKAPGRADAETAANLALKVSVIPSADVLEAIGRHTPGARMLIELCCQSATDRSKITSLTYLDEMENLFRGVPHEDTQRLLTRRFDELEDVGLEALALGAGGYPMAWDLCNYAN
jgi:hypothetical protein